MSEAKTIDEVREEAYRRDDAYFYDTCYGMTGGDLIAGPAFRRVSRQMATYPLEAVVGMLNDAHNAMAKRLRDAEARNRRSICTYCGTIQEAANDEERLGKMVDHMMVCEKSPVLRAVLALDDLAEARRLLSEALPHFNGGSDLREEIRTFLSGEGSDSMKGEK